MHKIISEDSTETNDEIKQFITKIPLPLQSVTPTLALWDIFLIKFNIIELTTVHKLLPVKSNTLTEIESIEYLSLICICNGKVEEDFFNVDTIISFMESKKNILKHNSWFLFFCPVFYLRNAQSVRLDYFLENLKKISPLKAATFEILSKETEVYEKQDSKTISIVTKRLENLL